MRLQELRIERKPRYVDESEPLFGRVRFSERDGAAIELPISEAAAKRILELCAEGMIEAAGAVAKLTCEQIIDSTLALPEKAPA